MTNKATHYGTCQCCGRRQMLPGGVLSKHGYTVEFGYFNGVCKGAGELPFEQSKDLVEGFIEGAEQYADDQEALAKKISRESDPTKVWMHRYKSDPKVWGRSYYVWEQVELEVVTKKCLGDSDVYHTAYIKGEERGHNYLHVTDGYKAKSADEYARMAAREHNRQRADRVERKNAKQAREYAAWQRKRIEGWKPSTLTPVKR